MIDNASTIKSCPLCAVGLQEMNPNYLSCPGCGLAVSRTNPAAYDETYYYGVEGITPYLRYRAMLLFNLAKRFFHENISVLDYGCNVGAFVDICNRNGYHADGFDINTANLELCRQTYSSGKFLNSLSDIKNRYDVITAFDVIEHFDNLDHFFEEAGKGLNDEGILIITTPNIKSNWISLFGFGWHGFGIPQYHRYILSRKGVELLAKRHGYDILEYKECGILGKNGWRYALTSEYRFEKDRLSKLKKVPIGLLKFIWLVISGKYYSDTIFTALKRHDKSS